MEIVTDEQVATVEQADAVRLLHEMAAVVRTIFAVPPVAPVVAPRLGGATPEPVTPSVAVVPPAAPASIPVPGAALLEEIAFLDDRP